jgi:antitoxin ParD1/3/4
MATENVNIRVTGVLRQHLNAQIGDEGLYDNASEYIRDLIRRDLLDKQHASEWLEQRLGNGLHAAADEFVSVSVEDIIASSKKRFM